MTESEMFGRRLQQILSEREITQKKLAEEIGVTSQTVHRWIVGESECRTGYREKICKVLNINPSELRMLDRWFAAYYGNLKLYAHIECPCQPKALYSSASEFCPSCGTAMSLPDEKEAHFEGGNNYVW